MEAIELGIDALARIEPAWNDLVRRAPEPTPFLRARWLRGWWEAFGEGRPRLVAAVDDSRRLVGGALFVERHRTFRGARVRTLSLAANVHSNRADLLVDADRVEEASAALAGWAAGRHPWWTLLRIDAVPADSVAVDAFTRALDARGFAVGVRRSESPPYIPLDGGRDAVFGRLRAKWRSNLRNRERRFSALGQVEHRMVRGGTESLDLLLDDCLALEASGWKGEARSAIASSPATDRFYRRLAADAANDGTLALHTLRLNGRLAAFQLDLEWAGVEYVLKIGYEPELSSYSPGSLLLRRVIDLALERNLRAIDLLGDDMPWKREWTDRVRPHQRVTVFGNGAVARMLSRVERVALPALRRARRAIALGRGSPRTSDERTDRWSS